MCVCVCTYSGKHGQLGTGNRQAAFVPLKLHGLLTHEAVGFVAAGVYCHSTHMLLVCVCVCVCLCMHVCMYVCTYLGTYVSM